MVILRVSIVGVLQHPRCRSRLSIKTSNVNHGVPIKSETLRMRNRLRALPALGDQIENVALAGR